MRRQLLLIVAFASFGIVTMGADSCGTNTTNTPDASSDSGGGSSGGSGGGGSKSQKARVGDSITIKTTETKLKVTVLGVMDPVNAGQYDQPAASRRYVGVQLSIRNVGGNSYSDAPSNGAQLVDNHDEQADPTLLTGGDCTIGFSSDVRLSPGSRQKGCIAFEIKKRAKPATFQFAGDSGFGPGNAEWTLR
jgi:hypothetical protein